MALDVPQLLIGGAAIMSPVLVFFTSRRGQKDTAQQQAGVNRVQAAEMELTARTAQIKTYDDIIKRHDEDREAEREKRIAAENAQEIEHEKRMEVQTRNDELYTQLMAIKGAVVGQTALVAEVFPDIGPNPTSKSHAIETETRRESDEPHGHSSN